MILEDLKKPMFLKEYFPVHLESGDSFNNLRGPAARFKYPTCRDKWYKVLGFCCKKPPIGWRNKRSFRGGIIRVMGKGKRQYDAPNFQHGCKPIPDWLKRAGWIFDDSPIWWRCDYEQWKSRDVDLIPGTIICIFKGEG